MSGSTAVVAILCLGFGAGILSGMFGIGGGLVIVPALVILFGLSQKAATGTSLFALLLPVGLLAVIGYYREGNARLDYGLLIAVGLFLGAYLGQKITTGVSDMTLKRLYAGFLVIVASYYLLISTQRGRDWLYGTASTDRVTTPKN
ncbi:MAG: hypothetical protein JWN86_2829 [Planctomycetota bacterium]|nr:hypothetical protein [Planctomycetota bacterium]